MRSCCMKCDRCKLALVISFVVVSTAAGQNEPGRHDLRPATATGETVRVKARFEVGGDLKIIAEDKPKTVPMSVVGQFVYDEQRLDDGSAADMLQAVRY